MSIIILIFSGQNPCTRIISSILHSFLDFSRALKKKKKVLWNNSKKKVRMGAQENKLQMLQISLNEILCMMILPVFSQFPWNLKSNLLMLPYEIVFGVITDKLLHLQPLESVKKKVIWPKFSGTRFLSTEN